MVSPLRYALVLTLSVAGAGMVGTAWAEEGTGAPMAGAREGASKAQDVVTGSEKAAVDTLRKNEKAVDSQAATEVMQRFASVINNGLSHNGFDDLIGSLSKTDRDRIDLKRFKNYDALNAKIDGFRKDFKDKYGQDFDFKSALLEKHLTLARIDKDHIDARFLGLHGGLKGDLRSDAHDVKTIERTDLKARDVKAVDDKMKDASPDVNKIDDKTLHPVDTPRTDARTDVKTDVRTDVKTDHTTVHTTDKDMAHHGDLKGDMAYLRFSLVNEGVVGNGWRIALPNVTADSLSDSLIKHIDMIQSAKATWPKDINDAQLLAGDHVLRALRDASKGSNVATENP